MPLNSDYDLVESCTPPFLLCAHWNVGDYS